MENEEDILWEADKRESNEALATRGLKFINWYSCFLCCKSLNDYIYIISHLSNTFR